MKKDITSYIINRLNLQDIVNVLSNQLSGSELNSVLLDVFNKRLQKETLASLLNQYKKNRFVKPIDIDFLRFKEDELKCYKILANKGFDLIELSPVAQLGTKSVVANVDQKKFYLHLEIQRLWQIQRMPLHYIRPNKRKKEHCEMQHITTVVYQES